MGHVAVGRDAAGCCELLGVVAFWGGGVESLDTMVVSVTMEIEVLPEMKNTALE